MPTNQVQLRRGTSTQCDAMTPAAGEMIVDTTNKRPRLGDGARAGGFQIPTYADIQNGAFEAATATGSANALVLAITPVPSAWTTLMGGRFKAASNNTGAATLEITSLSGTKTLKKKTSAGLADLSANDIVADGIYSWAYNGTHVVIDALNASASGLSSVSQGNLNTSTGAVSAINAIVTLPGGTYGFAPQIKGNAGTDYPFAFLTKQSALTTYAQSYLLGAEGTPLEWFTSGSNQFLSYASATDPSETGYLQQRYITASPPFDLGDGEATGFMFMHLRSDGRVKAQYTADVPPWAYNGPTDIACSRVCPITQKKFRTVMAQRSLEEIMDGAAITYVDEEITHAVKNADMHLIPHPFGAPSPGEKIVLLDPMDDRVGRLVEYINAGGADDVSAAIHAGKIYADNDALERRAGPAGVMQTRLRFKYSQR